jgi:hypothetical protein
VYPYTYHTHTLKVHKKMSCIYVYIHTYIHNRKCTHSRHRHDAEIDSKAEQEARRRAKEPAAGVRLVYKVTRSNASQHTKCVTFSANTMKALGESVKEHVVRSIAQCLPHAHALINGDMVKLREEQNAIMSALASTFRAPAGGSREVLLSHLVFEARRFVRGDAESGDPAVVLLQVCFCVWRVYLFCVCEHITEEDHILS